ncbi:MAG: hypothetical protein U0176_16875 [Bacteroidia bacterium]
MYSDWQACLYEPDADPSIQGLAGEDWQLIRFDEHSQVIALATDDYAGHLKLYRVDTSVPRVTLLYSEAIGERERKWIHLDLSRDGTAIAAAHGEFAVAAEGTWRPATPGFLTYVAAHGDRLTYKAEDLGFLLGDKWENETDQFFAVLHPNNRHGFFWTYGKSKLSVVDILRGEVVASKSVDGIGAMNVSENGSHLLLSETSNSMWAYRLPDLKLDFKLYHGCGYGWTPTGIAMNATADLAIAFDGHSRHLPIDYNFQVTDWDSHLVLWKKQADGSWKDIDAMHFPKKAYSIDAFKLIAVRAAGNKLYWAGEVNFEEVMWMELPSKRKGTVRFERGVSTSFSHDGHIFTAQTGRGYCMTLPCPSKKGERFEVVRLEYAPPQLAEMPLPPTDWQQHWDAGQARLDLTGTAFRRRWTSWRRSRKSRP